MFAFDAAALPQLKTRRALVVIDLQNDFVGRDAVLPVTDPPHLVGRTLELVEGFRAAAAGDVVWVRSVFDAPRPVDEEPIVACDASPPFSQRHQSRVSSRRSAASSCSSSQGAVRSSRADGEAPRRSRDGSPRGAQSTSRGRRDAQDQKPDDEAPCPDAEAFLSHSSPACVQPWTCGAEFPRAVARAIRPRDTVLCKSGYSAFFSTGLLRLLRAKMVMHVFICGSLTNIGVHATAMDAAGHGMAITLVEDCCGWRSDSRRMRALRRLVQVTGCEVGSCHEVVQAVQSHAAKPQDGQQDGQEEAKQEEAKQEEAKQEEAKQEEAKQEEAKQEEAKQKEAKQKEAKQKEAKQKEAKKKEASRQEDAQPETANQNDIEQTPARQDTAQPEAAKSLARGQSQPTDAASDSSLASSSDSTSSEMARPLMGLRLASDSSKETDGAVASDTESRAPRGTPPPSDVVQEAWPPDQAAGDGPEEQAAGNGPEQSAATDDDSDDAAAQSGLCEGDMDVFDNVLPPWLEQGIFERLRSEVQWQTMSHQGGPVPRLVAIQGLVSDSAVPVYRHPADEMPALLPFSPTVAAICAEAQRVAGHDLNHGLLQLYRSGDDYISEHSDKTLDIARGSYIVNVSLGAQRTMVLRSKRSAKSGARAIQRARLAHNSLCRMGPQTNMKWLHAIRADRRAADDKTPAERAHGGARISLTLRLVATFVVPRPLRIWGQGATAKTRAAARPVPDADDAACAALLRAFGSENNSPDFDWQAVYGAGFDVLHVRSSPRLFASPDALANLRVALMLAELGVRYARGSLAPNGLAPSDAVAAALPQHQLAMRYVDNDAARSVVHGEEAILLYLDARHARTASPPVLAQRFTLLQHAFDMARVLRLQTPLPNDDDTVRPNSCNPWPPALDAPLDACNHSLSSSSSSSSPPCVADFALWPLVHTLVGCFSRQRVFCRRDVLARYYDEFAARESVARVLGA